ARPPVVARSPDRAMLWHGLLTVPPGPTAGLQEPASAGRPTVNAGGLVGRPGHNKVRRSLGAGRSQAEPGNELMLPNAIQVLVAAQVDVAVRDDRRGGEVVGEFVLAEDLQLLPRLDDGDDAIAGGAVHLAVGVH